MKKILLILIMIFTIFLTSCEATITTPESYKVKFDSNNGSYVESQYIKGGQCASVPATPIKSNYDFEYWMLNGKEFDFSTPITSNITLVAKWKFNHPCQYIKTIIEPTCTEKGHSIYTCVCGDYYIDEYVSELGHSLIKYEDDGKMYFVCTRCEYISYIE